MSFQGLGVVEVVVSFERQLATCFLAVAQGIDLMQGG
jgi:hypothetical protein